MKFPFGLRQELDCRTITEFRLKYRIPADHVMERRGGMFFVFPCPVAVMQQCIMLDCRIIGPTRRYRCPHCDTLPTSSRTKTQMQQHLWGSRHFGVVVVSFSGTGLVNVCQYSHLRQSLRAVE